MKSLRWTICLCILSPLLAGSDSVIIQSKYSGFASNGRFKELQNKTLRFRCSPSVETSPSEKCRQLAMVLKAAKTAAREKPSNWLGITPEWLAANVDQAIMEDLKDLPGVTWPPTSAQVTLFRAAFLDPSTIADLQSVHLDSEPSVRIEVKSGKQANAEFQSISLDPSMAPWSVRVGGESFEAYDRAVGEALCPLLPEKFPNRTLVCGTHLRYEYSDRVFAAIYGKWKLAK